MNNMKRKNWKDEEIEYMQDKWGVISIPAIAKKLGRTVNAVRVKALKLGLGRHIHSGEYITLNQLFVALKGYNCGDKARKAWENKGLPIKYKNSIKKKYMIIYLEDFWEWAEKHKDSINFTNFEKNVLGQEPDWVDAQRKADFLKKRFKISEWTKSDDGMLTQLLKMHKYSYRELAKKINRTEGAIKKRILELGLRERPVRMDNHNKWKNEEIEKLKSLYKQGHYPDVIADYLDGRSALAIRGKVERLIAGGEMEPRNNCRKWF